MAIWWVDPYAEANIGGIHGTLDTTTRNGTYGYPFVFSDVAKSSATGLTSSINGQTISSGDEIRFKALASREDFLVDIGNQWYLQYGYRAYDTNSSNTNLTGLGSSWPSTAGTWGYQTTFVYDPVESDKVVQKSAGNFKPLMSQKYHRSSDTLWELRYSYNLSYSRMVLERQFPNSSYANMQLYALDPDYVVPYAADQIYLLCMQVPITVTDGWTSETTRNGYNFIRIGNSSTSTHTFYMNMTGNTNPNANTIYDMPDTGWDFHCNSSSTNPHAMYYYISSATDNGASVGYSYTQKPGAFYGSQTYGSYVYDYTGQYYNGSAYQSTSCNSIDITSMFANFTQIYGRYSSSNTTSYPTKTFRNMMLNYYPYIYSSFGYSQYYNIGTVYSNSERNGGIISMEWSPGSSGWLKLLDGSHYGSTNSNAVSLLSGPGTGLINNTFIDSADAFANTAYNSTTHIDNSSAIIFNYTNDSSSSWPLSSNYNNPRTIAAGGGQPGLLGKVKYSSTDWWTNGFVKGSYVLSDNTRGAYVLSQSVGVLDTGGADYTTTDCTIDIETDAIMYGSSTAYLQYPSFHFSRNTYDGKPIALLPAIDDGNANTACIGYNNDSNAFCIQSNPNDNGDYFGKDFEIALPTYDPSSQNIRIDCVYRYENLNGNGISTSSDIYYYYVNTGGTLSTVSATLSSSNSSNTTQQTTILGSNMAQGDDKRNHIVGRLRFANTVSNTSTPDRGRLVIVSLTATAV